MRVDSVFDYRWNGTLWSEDPSFVSSTVLKSVTLFFLNFWTISANSLVFVVLYKNPRLRTVPNLLVGNLAFSDLCLGCFVLPFSAVYTVTLDWRFGKTICEIWLSLDILVCTASIWNLSMIGLDRYWAITSPVSYLAKRNLRFAGKLIAIVWFLSFAISLTPFIGWKTFSDKGNFVLDNYTDTWQCVHFQDLPSFTIYSAVGSFWIPVVVIFFVYYRIYLAFEEHKVRQMYRQKVIRKHLESTILAELSQVLPIGADPEKEEEGGDLDSDEFSSSEEKVYDQLMANEIDPSNNVSDSNEDADLNFSNLLDANARNGILSKRLSCPEEVAHSTRITDSRTHLPVRKDLEQPSPGPKRPSSPRVVNFAGHASNKVIAIESSKANGQLSHQSHRSPSRRKYQRSQTLRTENEGELIANNNGAAACNGQPRITRSRSLRLSGSFMQQQAEINKSKARLTKNLIKQAVATSKRSRELRRKPKAISAAKEKRGVKVLGMILGCLTICWTPFFVMYLISGFCTTCRLNVHIEQFITWLGYANSAMNPIIYTVFNRDYQIALQRLISSTASMKQHSRVSNNAARAV